MKIPRKCYGYMRATMAVLRDTTCRLQSVLNDGVFLTGNVGMLFYLVSHHNRFLYT